MKKRQQIISNFKNRIELAFPNVKVDRGNPGQPVTHFPSIYIFEDVETSEKMNKILYRKTLPLVIEYFFQTKPGATIYIAGNEALEEFLDAVDTDVDLDGLCHEFGITESEIVEFRDGVCDLLTKWDFVYEEAKVLTP